MKKVHTYIVGILAAMVLAQGTQIVSAATVAELQAQLQQLMQQIQSLQAGTASVTAATTVSGYKFTRNLTVGSRGTDVKKLQDFLKSKGYLKITVTTTYFGPGTKAALAKWQAANKISPAVGYFGTLTRARVNALSASAPATPGTASVSYISRPVAAVVGSSVAIKFASTAARKANLYLCKTADDCRTVIAANVLVNAGDNTYTWAVPADVITGAYTIKVEDVANSEWSVYTDVPLTQPVATATSTPPATQPLIAAFALKQPATVVAGSLLKITFTSKNAKNANILLCTDTEHCDVTIAAKFVITDGINSYFWTVPATLAPRKYIIKIKDADVATSKEFTSDLFTVSPIPPAPPAPTIDITQPATTQAGTALAVKFTAKGVSSVNMHLCKSKTECNVTIKDGFAVPVTGSGTYAWTIPTSTVAGEYYLKITGTGMTQSTTTQVGTTAVIAGAPTPMEPQSLATTGFALKQPVSTTAGDLLKIAFTSKNVKNAKIVLCTDSEHCDVTITEKFAITDGVNNYIWTVPDTLAPRVYFIKIKDADSVTAKEFTSDLFTILPISSGGTPAAMEIAAFTKAPFTITAAKGTLTETVKRWGVSGVAPKIALCPDDKEPIAERSSCWTQYMGVPAPTAPNIKFTATDVTLYEGGAGVVCKLDPNPSIVYVEVFCANP